MLKEYHAQFEWCDEAGVRFAVWGFKDTWGYINLYTWEHGWLYTDSETMATAGIDTTSWNGVNTHFETPLQLKVQVNKRGARVVAIKQPVYEQLAMFA